MLAKNLTGRFPRGREGGCVEMELYPRVPPSAYLGGGSQEHGKNREIGDEICGVGVADGVELVTCELEHGQMSDATPSTSPVHMPGLDSTTSSRTTWFHPEPRSGSEWRSRDAEAASSWTPCVLPVARSSIEWKPNEACSCGTVDDCCEVPPISVPRLRKGGENKIEKKKFLRSNLCCSRGSCRSTEMEKNELRVLVAKEPTGAICTVAEDEWVEIEVAIDSGATETVMAEETLNGIVDITEGPALRRGVTYEVANGVEIPNLGKRKFVGFTEEGGKRGITAQVCSANKTFMSVSKVAAQGNRVVFDDEGSYIEDKVSGERTWMQQVGGMYMLKMWVSRKTTKEAGF